MLSASQQVGRPIFFAMGIIILAFVPIFTLTGQEENFSSARVDQDVRDGRRHDPGRHAGPRALHVLVRSPFHSENRNWVMRALLALYDPVLDWALRCRKTVLGLAAALLAFCLVLAFGLPAPLLARLPSPVARHLTGFGSEFMPTLQEGSALHAGAAPTLR